jgi:mycothiol synthase
VTTSPQSPSGASGLPVAGVPDGWTVRVPGEPDAGALAALVRSAEQHGRGWPGASRDALLVEVSARGARTRRNVALWDPAGTVRAWGGAHDRVAGRMLLRVVVSPELNDATADRIATALFAWGDDAARQVARARGIGSQQVDSGAFADDVRQHRWLRTAGYEKVRTWWQMTRPVAAEDARLDAAVRAGVRIRAVAGGADGMPAERDLRTIHDVLESAFADHFNSHEETFDEFVLRLRESPGHRWDHWWVAELVDGASEGGEPEPAGALVGSVADGGDGPDGSYVEYLGVLGTARGRGVAKSLLATVVADAAARGRDRVGLEVDADSPTGAERLYTSLGWRTSYVTESWHRHVDLDG